MTTPTTYYKFTLQNGQRVTQVFNIVHELIREVTGPEAEKMFDESQNKCVSCEHFGHNHCWQPVSPFFEVHPDFSECEYWELRTS